MKKVQEIATAAAAEAARDSQEKERNDGPVVAVVKRKKS